MSTSNNIIKFPNLLEKKKKELSEIRDEIEMILTNYSISKKDLWAVSLAAGRFSSINLMKIEGQDKAIKFFNNCMETQKKFELSRNSSNITRDLGTSIDW